MRGYQRLRRTLAAAQPRLSRPERLLLALLAVPVGAPILASVWTPLSLRDTLPAALLARPTRLVPVAALLVLAGLGRRLLPAAGTRATRLVGYALVTVAAGWNLRALVTATSGSAVTRTVVLGGIRGLALAFGVVWIAINVYNFYPLVRGGLGRIAGRLTGGPAGGPAVETRREQPRPDGGASGRIDPHGGEALPEIDLLLPAYREAEVIASSIRSIRGADYPTDRLNLYVLLEADDRETPQVLSALVGDYEFTRLTVPEGYPGEPNKPRALNYGFEHSGGDVVGVIDAEDVVAPDLFTEVADALGCRGNDFALGHLDMANEDDGWLNLQFRAEYGWWYGLVVPAYHGVDYPVPLGGTTCFFRRSTLAEISDRRAERYGTPWDAGDRAWLSRHGFAGAIPWDPTNVTEDFELGLLLWEEGYEFAYLDAVTREESPTTLDGWIRQRTRWNKGKLYTFFGYLEEPPATLRDRLHLYWQSLLPHLGPLNVVAVVFVLLLANFVTFDPGPAVEWVLGIGLSFALVVVGTVSYGYWQVSDRPRPARVRRTCVVAATLPVYWLFQWGADLRALRQAYLGRFDWAKTTHEGRHTVVGRRLSPADAERTRNWVLARHRRLLALAAVLAVAAAVRLYGLGAPSLWTDELYSVAVRAQLPALDLLVVPRDPHPPLYYLLLHYWLELFGSSAVAARLFSVLCSLGAVVAVVLLGSELFDDRVGLVGGLLFALSTFQIHYGRTARMYALFAMLAAGSWYWFARLRADGRYSGAGYVLTTAALLYTHLFGVFVLLAQWLHVLLSGTNAGVAYRRWGRLQAAVATLGLPLVAVLGGRLLGTLGGAAGSVDWIPLPSTAAVAGTVLSYAGFPAHYPIRAGSALVWLLALVLTYLYGGTLVSAVVRVGREAGYELDAPERVGGLALLFVVPIAAPLVLSHLLVPIYVPRYTVAATVGLYLLVARGIVNLERPRLRALLLAVVVAGSLVMVGAYHAGDSAENWAGAVDRIETDGSPEDLLVLQPGWIDTNVDYYGTAAETVGVGADLGDDDRRRLRGALAGHDRVWVLRYGPAAADDPGAVLAPTHRRTGGYDYGVLALARFDRDPGGPTGYRVVP
jgi:cellulose synthase/poly-beta-1,6-N-acetylglucosamine synthase-like glycosyltransferase